MNSIITSSTNANTHQPTTTSFFCYLHDHTSKLWYQSHLRGSSSTVHSVLHLTIVKRTVHHSSHVSLHVPPLVLGSTCLFSLSFLHIRWWKIRWSKSAATDSGRAHKPIGFFFWYSLWTWWDPHWVLWRTFIGSVESRWCEKERLRCLVLRALIVHFLLKVALTPMAMVTMACWLPLSPLCQFLHQPVSTKTKTFSISHTDISFHALVSMSFNRVLENWPLLSRIHVNIYNHGKNSLGDNIRDNLESLKYSNKWIEGNVS